MSLKLLYALVALQVVIKIKKSVSVITIVAMFVVATLCLSAVASAAVSLGPAPNSGDCIPDGSGFDQPNRQNDAAPGVGPAPNSGDGVPDGSGF